MDRNAVWKDIWIKKGLDRNALPHLADGYDLLSPDEFDHLVFRVTQPIALKGNESILECGCGAGAFLASLLKIHPELKVSGVDYSPTLLEIARKHVDGEFFAADMTDLGFLARDAYDCTISFGVILYLSSKKAARRAIEEMLRVTKPGGSVYIGEVPDATKRDLAVNIRRISHQAAKKISKTNPDHLYLSKGFFQEIADASGVDLKIVDHSEFDLGNYQAACYRYSIYITKEIRNAK